MDKDRFKTPLFTVAEAAAHLAIPKETVRRWSTTVAVGAPLVHRVEPEVYHGAVIPFVAMGEALLLRAFRDSGLSFRAIVEGVTALRRDLGDEYILASNAIAHDGTDVLVNLAEDGGDPEWSRARDRQRGIKGVIEMGLAPIVFASDGYPEQIRLTAYESADVIIDPRFGFGQPIVGDNGVRVEDVVDLFLAGEPISVVCDEFGVSPETVENLVRVQLRGRAAA